MIKLPDLIQALHGAKRIAIVGGPRTGKTTLARRLYKALDRIYAPVETDSFSNRPWEAVPSEIISALANSPDFILEGVQAARCLRKGLEVDAVIALSEPKVERTAHQEAMAKGVDKIFSDWARTPGPKPLIIYIGGEK